MSTERSAEKPKPGHEEVAYWWGSGWGVGGNLPNNHDPRPDYSIIQMNLRMLGGVLH